MEHQKAFDNIKSCFCTEPILHNPSHELPFWLETNASNYTTGMVLSQLDNGKWKPVAFMSKSMTECEHNYNVHDKELLAIIHALEDWCHYLEGVPIPIQIHTNHCNLE